MRNCKYIFHAVGPNMADYQNKVDECYELLKRTFFNIFIRCEKLKLKSVAVPLISSGIYSVPKFVCCQQLYSAINDYIETGAHKHLELIKIVSIERQANKEIVDFFNEQLNKIIKKPSSSSSSATSEEASAIATATERIVVISSTSHTGKCSLCAYDKPIVKSLICGCQYCKSCVDNYEQSFKCECKDSSN